MLLTAMIKLEVSEEQRSLLLRTRERRNQACNGLSAIAFHDLVWNKFELHRKCYRGIRDYLGISAQMTVRDIKKVADSYRTDGELLKDQVFARSASE